MCCTMTTIYLIRHGETDWNRAGRWQGHADIPLSEDGRKQARALAQRLLDERVRFDHIYASDLSRALETAQIVAAPLHMPVHPLTELREIDVGGWSGLTRAEIVERFPGAFTTVFHAPDGETRELFTERVAVVLLRLAVQHPGERLAIVTHGGAVRAMVRSIYERHDHDQSVPFIGNTSITELAFDDGAWRVLRLNDATHVVDEQAPDMLAPQHGGTGSL